MRSTSLRVLAGLALLGFAGLARAATYESVSIASDVPVALGGTTLMGKHVAADNLLGVVVPTWIGSLPEAASVTAYHRLANGDALLAFGTTLALDGGPTVRPGDVVRFDGAGYTLAFDAAANGIGAGGAAIDAVSMIAGTDLLLSFDVTVDLGPYTAGDEDLVRCQQPVAGVCQDFGVWPWFDGSMQAGLADGLDLDGAHFVDESGAVLLSFDGSGSLGGVAFDDEDVLEYTPATGAWTLVYDGSAEHPGWTPGDLVAVHAPTPQMQSPRRRCGLGFELAPLLAVLFAARGRRRASPPTCWLLRSAARP